MELKTESKATARPWKVTKLKVTKGRNGCRSYDAISVSDKAGQSIARIWTNKPDADLIVRAVNLLPYYEAVAEASSRYLDAGNRYGFASDEALPLRDEWRNQVQNLAAVQGGAK